VKKNIKEIKEKVKESQKNIDRPKLDKKERSKSEIIGFKKFYFGKNWSRDPLFVVISFLPILSTSLEFSTGHAFHLFKLIFSVVTFLCSKMKKKYQRNKRKKSKNPKKILIDQK